ncbi:MAG TPA: DUF3052 domain-containing protein [Cyclobacteriaceae bacterium]|nr:DUF3052 domain-containing protein [Cyclobacteriaceae bacterium]
MAGYSGTPLGKKLGLKEAFRCKIISPPDDYFNWISPLPPDLKINATKDLDFIHLFVKDLKTFSKQFLANKKILKKDGMMWISWPKKSAKIPTDLDENIIRDFGLKNGLVDVKVCAVDDTWSGLKFVYRLSDR